MIASFSNNQAQEVFLGNWGALPVSAYGPLEDCFIDLRILDAAAVEQDLRVAFRGRLYEGSGLGPNKRFTISSEAGIPYSINFIWTGSAVEALAVTLTQE
jgi:hypothetical protein